MCLGQVMTQPRSLLLLSLNPQNRKPQDSETNKHSSYSQRFLAGHREERSRILQFARVIYQILAAELISASQQPCGIPGSGAGEGKMPHPHTLYVCGALPVSLSDEMTGSY